MQSSLNIFPYLKHFGLWLTIRPLERGELLCLENVTLLSPFLVLYFYKVWENAMTKNRKRTGAMLYTCLTTTLKGMDVSIFPIISLTTLFLYIVLIAEKKRGGVPCMAIMSIRSL